MSVRFRVAVLLLVPVLLLGCGGESSPTPVLSDTAPAAPVVDAGDPALASWDTSTTVGTIVAERPSTARLFELVGIDYCCGGAKTIAQAAKARELDVDSLLGVLAAMSGAARVTDERDWMQVPIGELIDHIENTHHAYLRRELPRLTEIVGTVARVHGDKHPELLEVKQVYTKLHDAIGPHLEDEEANVFPAIRDAATDPARLKAMVARLRTDHDDVGGALKQLRQLTKGYALPEDACALYTQMFEGLAALERDLHQHVHLENNALLPRAEQMSGS